MKTGEIIDTFRNRAAAFHPHRTNLTLVLPHGEVSPFLLDGKATYDLKILIEHGALPDVTIIDLPSLRGKKAAT